MKLCASRTPRQLARQEMLQWKLTLTVTGRYGEIYRWLFAGPSGEKRRCSVLEAQNRDVF